MISLETPPDCPFPASPANAAPELATFWADIHHERVEAGLGLRCLGEPDYPYDPTCLDCGAGETVGGPRCRACWIAWGRAKL